MARRGKAGGKPVQTRRRKTEARKRGNASKIAHHRGSSAASIKTTCCIAGGGPAGMMLGFLLARAGLAVTVLEKHADFLRDFRGDTVHPSTLELMYELGLLDEFLKMPHEKVDHLTGQIGAERITIADFSHLPTHCRFIALMPQWDFLNFLAAQGNRYPSFDLRMRTEATDLIEEGGRVVGLRAKAPDGDLEIGADLVVGCDGRHSTVRERAGLRVDDIGAPIDVLWFRISRHSEDSSETFGHIEAGRMMVMLNRGDYWQCAYVIPKGKIDDIKQKGLPAFRDSVVYMSPSLRDRIDEIKSWDDVKLLTVAVDRLREWHRPGLHLHRRRGPCDVAGWRRGNQSGGSGRGCHGEHSGRAAQGRPRHARAPPGGAAAAEPAGAGNPMDASAGPEQRSGLRAGNCATARRAVRDQAAALVPGVAKNSSAPGGDGDQA